MIELTHKRKWDSKIFDTGRSQLNADGVTEDPIYGTKLQNGLHDIEPDGSFVEVVKRFRPYVGTVSTDEVTRGRGKVKISDTGSESKDRVKITTKRDCGVSLKLKGFRTYGPNFNTLNDAYYDTYDGITLRYYPSYKGVNIVIEVANPQTASNIFKFTIKEYGCSYTYEKIPGGIKCISSTGEDDIFIKALYAIDANGESGSVDIFPDGVDVDGYQIAKKVVDPIWYGNAVGPVLIDPSITIEDGVAGGIIEDNLLLSANPTTNYGAATFGRTSNTASALTYVDLSSLAGVTPLNGKFMCTTNGSGSATFKAYKLLKRFVESESTWNIYKTGFSWETAGAKGATDRAAVEEGTFLGIQPAGTVIDVDITVPTLTEWLTTNNGLLLEYVPGGIGTLWQYNSAEGATTPVQFYMEYTTGGDYVPFFFGAGYY